LKYCPRIIFYIKNNPPGRILWRIKENVTLTLDILHNVNCHQNIARGKVKP
jgi:hypothetical protein